jgi:hypothetical protein
MQWRKCCISSFLRYFFPHRESTLSAMPAHDMLVQNAFALLLLEAQTCKKRRRLFGPYRVCLARGERRTEKTVRHGKKCERYSCCGKTLRGQQTRQAKDRLPSGVLAHRSRTPGCTRQRTSRCPTPCLLTIRGLD